MRAAVNLFSSCSFVLPRYTVLMLAPETPIYSQHSTEDFVAIKTCDVNRSSHSFNRQRDLTSDWCFSCILGAARAKELREGFNYRFPLSCFVKRSSVSLSANVSISCAAGR